MMSQKKTSVLEGTKEHVNAQNSRFGYVPIIGQNRTACGEIRRNAHKEYRVTCGIDAYLLQPPETASKRHIISDSRASHLSRSNIVVTPQSQPRAAPPAYVCMQPLPLSSYFSRLTYTHTRRREGRSTSDTGIGRQL